MYNYRRLSRASRVSENVYGILSTRLRVLRKVLLLNPEKVEVVVNVCAQPNTIDSEDKDTGEIIAGAWKSETNGQTAFLSLTKKSTKFNYRN